MVFYSITQDPETILYRRSITTKYKSWLAGLKSADVSKIVGQLWKDENKEVRKLFETAARIAKKRFMEKYPNYRYEPKANNKEKSNETAVQHKADTPETPTNNFQPNVDFHTLNNLIKLVDFIQYPALDP